MLLDGPRFFGVPEPGTGTRILHAQSLLGFIQHNNTLVKTQKRGVHSIKPPIRINRKIGTSGTRHGNGYRR